MSEKQLLHEINSSREATEEIRKQVLQAKQKGYFSNTEFGRHFLSIFVPDFAKELLQTISKEATFIDFSSPQSSTKRSEILDEIM